MSSDRETKIPFPRIWAIVAGMPCGPIEIPKEFRFSEKNTIFYTLNLMKTYIKGRACIEWDLEGKKKPTHFWRDKNGKPYCEIKN